MVFDPSGRVLLLKHVSGDWVFPKGHLEAGEDALQAALREVAEEAGVNASCEDPERSWVTRYRNSRGERREITWFRCHTPATEVHITEDLFSTGGFFAPKPALELLSHAEDRELLHKIAAERERGR